MHEILLLIAIFIGISFIVSGFSLAPWVPARSKDLDRIHEVANLKPGDKLYEIGSGDGRVSFYLAKKNPHAQITGIEMSLPLYVFSRTKLIFSKQQNLQFKFGNALKKDLSPANVIYTFAMVESLNDKLKQKFLNELQKGSRIISYVFSMKEWPGKKHLNKPTPKSSSIHIYEV